MSTQHIEMADGNSDAHENQGGASFSASALFVACQSHTTPGSEFNGGFWFDGVLPGNGDTINSATLDITPNTLSNDDANVAMHMEDADDPGNFSTTADVTSRARTTASASWVADALGTSRVTSPSFATAMQEVVDRAGWATGQAMTVLFIGNSDAIKNLRPISYDSSSTDAADLDIDYTAAAAGTGAQIVGGRSFPGFSIAGPGGLAG